MLMIDRISRKLIWWASRKKGLHKWYNEIVENIYDGVLASV